MAAALVGAGGGTSLAADVDADLGDAPTEAAATVSGLLFYPDGGPAAGAHISSWPASTDGCCRATVHEDGRFSFDRLPPGTTRFVVQPPVDDPPPLWALPPDDDPAPLQWLGGSDGADAAIVVDLAPHQELDLGEVELVTEGGYVEGRVTGPGGASASHDAEVSVAVGGDRIVTRTRGDGRYRLGPVAPGDVLVHADAGGLVPGWHPDATEAGEAALVAVAPGATTEADIALPAATAPFVDVPFSQPFATGIEWVANHGIAEGWSDGTFRPGEVVTREAIAAFLYRYEHVYRQSRAPQPGCTDGGPFPDVAVDHPFCTEIEWLADHHVGAGYADGTFGPSNPVSRQAMMAMLERMGESPPLQWAHLPRCQVSAWSFADVPTDHPFCQEVQVFAHDGLVAQGWPDGTFRPATPVSREAAAAFLHRFSSFSPWWGPYLLPG